MAQRKFPDWAIVPGLLSNGDNNVVDPGAAKQDAGWAIEKPLVQSMNWLQNLFGHFIRANNEFKSEATGYEAEAGEIVLMDNLAAIATGKLPAAPLDGQWVEFGGRGLYSDFEVTIDGNGTDIMVVGTTAVTLDANNTMYLFNYRLSSDLWEINLGIKRGAV